MAEHISSDETSTNETVFTDTTLVINAGKCLFCDRILGYQGKFASDNKYHYSCLERKNCIFCGCSGMNVLCKRQGCMNVFHTFCLQRYCKKSNLEELECGNHQDKKKEKTPEYSFLFKKIANNIQTDFFSLTQYIEQKIEIKPHIFSHGQIFWSIIGTQYFPSYTKLYNMPLFSSKRKKHLKQPHEKNWVSLAIKSINKEHKIIRSSNINLFKEIFPKNSQKRNIEKCKLNEKEILVCETKSKYKKIHKNFLGFIERNMKPQVIDEDSVICAICMEDDYDDDDLILSCKFCGVTVHMQCYGVSLDDKEYTCSLCSSNEDYKNYCALCPIKGGVLKPTINTASDIFQTHQNLPYGTKLWVHLFCAMHIDSSCIKNKYKMEEIDLKTVDKKKFLETCEICKTQNGACIKCSHSRCKVFFHPSCSKNQFLYTRNKTGFEEVSVFCETHRPSKLRRSIEMKEKRMYLDFVNFVKAIEKFEKSKARRNNEENIT